MEKDYLFIEGLEAEVRIGTTKAERAFPQVLFLSFKLVLPLKKAGQSDHLKHTVDWALVINQIQRHLQGKSFALVETVLEQVAALVLKQKAVQAVEVRADKKIFAGIHSVGASIYRTRNSAGPRRF